ncbi:MAG: hypothetical protein ACPL25_00920 [Ignavibacteria bacterium]
MDCKKFQEYLSAFVDDQIDEQIKIDAQNHISVCNSCFFDYKIELLVKKVVSTKFRKVSCPEHIKNKIISSLVHRKSPKGKITEIFDSIIQTKKFRISFAIGLIVIISILIFQPFKSPEEKYYQQFAAMVYENCKNLRNHKYPEKTIFTSDNEQAIQFIFANGIKNPVMPKTDWKVAVAGIEEQNNCLLAHFLFKCEVDTVYMMECEVDALRFTNYYDLFQKIHDDLRKKSFVKVDHENCSIIFRLEKNVLMTYAMRSDNHHTFEELIASLE